MTASNPLTAFESRCISLILKGRINKTYKAVADFRSKDKYGSRGMGINWNEEKKKGLESNALEMYQSFFQNSSGQDKIPRAAVIFYDMLGKNPWDTKRLLKKLEINISNDAFSVIIRDLNKYLELRKIADYKTEDIEEYEILGCDDSNGCELCKKMNGKIFNVSEANSGVNLPPFCDHCRCTTAPYISEAAGQ